MTSMPWWESLLAVALWSVLVWTVPIIFFCILQHEMSSKRGK